MFKLHPKKVSEKVKGWFAVPVPYEVNNPKADWSPYFVTYENQKWGQWDSDDCWCLSGINNLQAQLNLLKPQFSSEATNFFTTNGYLDVNGNFCLSERFIEILSGVADNGNSQMAVWTLIQKYGCIPRTALTYTLAQAQADANETLFEKDYYNPAYITPAMEQLGLQFLEYVSVDTQWIGDGKTTPPLQVLRAALAQAPLQIGIPVNVSQWNNSYVPYDGSKVVKHAINMLSTNPTGYVCYDQYQPDIKTLAPDYYIPLLTQGVATVIKPVESNPVPQNPVNNSVWQQVLAYLRSIKIVVGGIFS